MNDCDRAGNTQLVIKVMKSNFLFKTLFIGIISNGLYNTGGQKKKKKEE